MNPSFSLRSSPGSLLGGWREIADDVAAIAAVMRVSDGACHCVHDGRAFCSCCAASSAQVHDVCEACDRLLKRLDAACAALEDHSLRFAPALIELTHADGPTSDRFARLCAVAARLRHLLFAVEVRTATSGGDHCRTSDLAQLAPVATDLAALALELADTVTRGAPVRETR
jgi:hypothetical protein